MSKTVQFKFKSRKNLLPVFMGDMISSGPVVVTLSIHFKFHAGRKVQHLVGMWDMNRHKTIHEGARFILDNCKEKGMFKGRTVTSVSVDYKYKL